MDFIGVALKSWERFNYRPDVKKPHWFRLDHNIFEDADLFNLDAVEMAAFVYILCQASKKSGGVININVKHAQQFGRIPKKKLITSITKLEAADVLTRNGHVTDAIRPRTNAGSTGHNITIHNITKTTDLDFNALYQNYPRKEGKKDGLVKLKTSIKTPEDFEKVSTAIEAYKAHVIKNKIESKFIKHFSTFVSSWEDWLDPATGSAIKSDYDIWKEEVLKEEAAGL